MSDYSVRVAVKNGRILRRMGEIGIPSAMELSRMAGVSYNSVVQIISLKRAPRQRDGEWSEAAERIAATLKCDVEDLWTPLQEGMALERNSTTVEMSEPEVLRIMDQGPEQSTWAQIETRRLLGNLRAREERVVRMRMDGMTYEEIGRAMDVTGPRARQIEERAIRRMKQARLSSDNAVKMRMMQ